MSELLKEFEQLIAQLPPQRAGSATEVLLQVLDPLSARHLRLCAISHTFNPEILQALAPDMNREDAEAQCERFSELSCVSAVDDGELTLHSAARIELFRRWLEPPYEEEFSAASARLVAYFDGAAESSSTDTRETARRRHMFHLLGAHQALGFAEFETLCREARHQSRLSACAHLISLVHEYDSVLTRETAVALAYHEGKLASDLRTWDSAERLFEQVLGNPAAGPDLLAKARLRLGFIFYEHREFAKAIDQYQLALQIALRLDGAGIKPYEVLTSLGEAYRESGDLVQAEELLKNSLASATLAGDLSALANVYNDLGKLHFQRKETEEATDCYQKSLDALTRAGDRFRSAQVLNNLGMVFAETGEWDRADELYRQSLAIKREAGDTLGQAKTLLHQVRVLRSRGDLAHAIEVCSQAIALFAEIHAVHAQAQAVRTLARMHAATGDLKAAAKAFSEALVLLKRSRSADETKVMQEELARLTRKVGTPWWVWLAAALFVVAILVLLLVEVAS